MIVTFSKPTKFKPKIKHMIHLKTRNKEPQEFAVLVEPSSFSNDGGITEKPIRNDKDLYAAVWQAGGATICPIPPDSYNYGPPQNVSPAEFEAIWRGD